MASRTVSSAASVVLLGVTVPDHNQRATDSRAAKAVVVLGKCMREERTEGSHRACTAPGTIL
jgi:hypothetical protein